MPSTALLLLASQGMAQEVSLPEGGAYRVGEPLRLRVDAAATIEGDGWSAVTEAEATVPWPVWRPTDTLRIDVNGRPVALPLHPAEGRAKSAFPPSPDEQPYARLPAGDWPTPWRRRATAALAAAGCLLLMVMCLLLLPRKYAAVAALAVATGSVGYSAWRQPPVQRMTVAVPVATEQGRARAVDRWTFFRTTEDAREARVRVPFDEMTRFVPFSARHARQLSPRLHVDAAGNMHLVLSLPPGGVAAVVRRLD